MRLIDYITQLQTGGSVEIPDNLLTSDDLGQGLTLLDDKITLDVVSKSLVSPVISVQWSLFKNDGVTAHNPAISSSTALVVDVGVKASMAAKFKYPVPNAAQIVPQTVTGTLGTTLPAADVFSPVTAVNNIAANRTDTVNLFKPKSGLPVSGGQVGFPSGNDTTNDSISISFQGRGILAYFPDAVLTPAQIESVLNAAPFKTSKAETYTGVNASGGQYVYYLRYAPLGRPTAVLQNGATPVFGAFQFLANVTITNAAGAAVAVTVMRSNNVNSFNNVSLAFS